MKYAMTMALVAGMALSACNSGDQAKDATQNPANAIAVPNVAANAANVAEAPAGNAVDGNELAAGDPESPIYGDCYLRIDGKVYMDIKRDCPILSLHDGQSSLILNSDGESEIKGYFAYLTPNGDGTAGASWNQDRGATHAQAPLSEKLKRDGACWADDRVRICAVKR